MTSKLGLWTKVGRYLRDPRVSPWRKLTGLWAVLYVASPIDLAPDFIPMLGWLDDAGVMGAVAWFFVRELRKYNPGPAGRPVERSVERPAAPRREAQVR